MADGTSSDHSAKMDRIVKLTLSLGSFMLLLLISLPFTMSSGSLSGTAPYLLYSLFLTSVGIVIGISLTWLNDPTRLTDNAISDLQATKTQMPMLSSDEKVVVNILASNGGSMWQAEVVRASGFSNSKASRLLSRMEHSGIIGRLRDGMGKRIELIDLGGE
jgi:hypothetical protein